MAKNVTFTDQDEKLIEQIKAFQKSSGLPTFVSAVRKLCYDALQLKQITK